jgi:hypothetical protein
MAQLSLDRIGQIVHLITSKTFNETPLYLPDRGAFCQVLVAAAFFADLVVLDKLSSATFEKLEELETTVIPKEASLPPPCEGERMVVQGE